MTVLDLITDLSTDDDALAGYQLFIATVTESEDGDGDGKDALLTEIGSVIVSEESTAVAFCPGETSGGGVEAQPLPDVAAFADWAGDQKVETLDFDAVTVSPDTGKAVGLIAAVVLEEEQHVWLLEGPESQWPADWFAL